MRALLDTSVIVDGRALDIQDDVAISAITLAELHFGVLVARSPEQRQARLRRLTLVSRALEALPVDEAVAMSHGELAAADRAAGRNPRSRALDLLVAATAHAHGARLYTLNPGDFAAVSHLVDVVIPASRPPAG